MVATLSIMTPCFNEGENVDKLFQEICSIKEQLPDELQLELVYVDDGSSDDTYERILALSKQSPSVRYVRFRAILVKKRRCLRGWKR